jgi:hypothetical protein
MRRYRVLGGQWMQAESGGNLLHLVLAGLVQADPCVRFMPGQLQFGYLGARVGVRVLAGQALPVDIDAAVDHRLVGGQVQGLGLRMRGLVPFGPCLGTQCFR